MTDLAKRIAALPPEKRALLEQLIKQRKSDDAGLTIQRQARDGQMIPLSFAQERFWIIHHLDPTSAVYNIPIQGRFSDTLDINLLEKCFIEIIKRHEILRTTFASHDNRPVQIITDAVHFTLPLTDLRSLSKEERTEAIQEQLLKESKQPFDLLNGPLLRARVLHVPDEYLVIINQHHSIADDWSTGVLVRELITLAHALKHGQSAELAPLPVQYADYAVWQRERWEHGALDAQFAYWQDHLAGSLPTLDLPLDHRRPALQSNKGAHQQRQISADLLTQAREVARTQGVTTFMLLLTVFKVLLYRYAGQQDLIVGTPIANRTPPETEKLIGCFINMLALRTHIDGQLSFEQLLKRVQKVTLDAYDHAEVPFEKLVEAFRPERDLSRHPLFQVLFLIEDPQKARQQLLQGSNEFLGYKEIDNGTSKFDLTLLINEVDHIATIVYSTDLFEAATIDGMLAHYEIILERVLNNPQQPIAQHPLLTHNEALPMIEQWNTPVDYTDTRLIHDVFIQQAQQTPAARAIFDTQREYSYAELDQVSNQLAHYLQAQGVGPEETVGVCMHRSTQVVVALLAILKAGGAYLPLDPDYPHERLATMLRAANVSLVLTTQTLQEQIPAEGSTIICMDSLEPTLAHYSTDYVHTVLTPDNLAYVIFTSGSTGVPKGVLVSHRGIYNLAKTQSKAFNVQAEQRVMQMASLSFDASVSEIWMALGSGAALALPFKEAVLPGPELINLIDRWNISTVTFPPSLLAALSTAELPSLQTIITAGEPCSTELVQRWAPGRLFYNAYGPTETTVCATMERCVADATRITVGRPIDNMQVYLLDQHWQLVPPGLPGEICVGGIGLARGYLNQPGLTAERFIAHPFSEHPGARLYRTGDRGRLLADGRIEFLGRRDQQVKVRGFRIEPGEIEAVLMAHPDVQEQVVIAREDRAGDRRLVAYVVPKAATTLDSTALRTFLRQHLPEYMVPSMFVMLEALPLNQNGKLDRKALPAPNQSRSSRKAAYVAPQTPVESTLAQIWAEVLGYEQVGVYDNFFDLGGDSILSLQVVAKANQSGFQLLSRHMFQHQTIAELAPVVTLAPTIQAEQGLIEGAVPLTPIQSWFFERAFVEPNHWNQVSLLDVRQQVDAALLEQAFAIIVEHHDALRLRFKHSGQQWHGDAASSYVFSVHELQELDQQAQQAAIEQHAAATQAQLDFEHGPMLRAVLFERGTEQPQQLLIVMHHLVCDGVSWRILLSDLQQVYQQLKLQVTPQLPPKTTSFKYWAEQLHSYAQTAEAAAQAVHWTSIAQPTLDLLFDYERGVNGEGSVHIAAVQLSAAETHTLTP